MLLQTGLARPQLHPCPVGGDAGSACEPFSLQGWRGQAWAAPALAAREGAQGSASSKKEEEQQEKENAKLAQWVDLLFKCS